MKFFCCSILFFLPTIFVSAQKTVSVTGEIKNASFSNVYLRGYTGKKTTFILHTTATAGKFTFIIPDTLRGLCSINGESDTLPMIRIIADGKPVSFSTDAKNPVTAMAVKTSIETKAYYDYLQGRKVNTYAPLATMYANLHEPITPLPTDPNPRAYRRNHLFDHTDFSNADLLHTDLFLPKVFEFIALFDNGNLPFDLQADTLSLMIDRLMEHAAKNETVYNYLVSDLSDRFRYGSYDFLCAYLTKYYAARFAEKKGYSAATVRQRLNDLTHPMPGRTAPDIVMEAPGGTTTNLRSIPADYTLVVFWSTGCSHCIQTLPLLKRIYDARRGSFEILAVSFDTDLEAWQKFVRENNLGWLNYSDLQGWNSPIAKDYDIQGTPTYLLLDKNKKIITKPIELKDLAAELQKLSII